MYLPPICICISVPVHLCVSVSVFVCLCICILICFVVGRLKLPGPISRHRRDLHFNTSLFICMCSVMPRGSPAERERERQAESASERGGANHTLVPTQFGLVQCFLEFITILQLHSHVLILWFFSDLPQKTKTKGTSYKRTSPPPFYTNCCLTVGRCGCLHFPNWVTPLRPRPFPWAEQNLQSVNILLIFFHS